MPKTKKIWAKILVIILVFTLTFSNFAIVGKSAYVYAADSFFAKQISATSNKNVTFDAFFKQDEQETYELESDVNNEELIIHLELEVQNSGYLKNAKIEFKGENEKNPNFLLKANSEEYEMIQSLEDTVINLKQINGGIETKLDIPIEYRNEQYVDISTLSQNNKVVFTATYIDDKGKQKEIEKEIDLKLSWIDNKKISQTSELIKYVPYHVENMSGVIVQTNVKLNTESEKTKTLPVKEIILEVQVPDINGKKVENVNVVAKNTYGVNGVKDEFVKFNETNWSYRAEENLLTINVENNKNEEEKYFSGNGETEFLITYTYASNCYEEVMGNNITLYSNISSNIKLYSASDIKTIDSSAEAEYALTEKIGDLVTYSIENETKNISKGYMYANFNNENNPYEMEIAYKSILNVASTDLVEKMVLQDNGIVLVSKNQTENILNKAYYKNISISKENFKAILGENGSIDILSNGGIKLSTINMQTQTDENNNLVYNFDTGLNQIKIETTNPIQTGNLIINTKRVLKENEYSKDIIVNSEKIAYRMQAKAQYTYVDKLVDLSSEEAATKLDETKTKVGFQISKNTLSTVATNENIEMRLVLNNNEITSDMFGNSVYEIILPEFVENVEITNSNIVYGEGLEIAGIETYYRNSNIVIKITVSGKQTAFSTGSLSNGTNIVLNTNIKVNLFTTTREDSIKLNFYNEEATNYSNEVEWALDFNRPQGVYNLNNGYAERSVEAYAPSGLVAVNATKNYNLLGKTIASVEQGLVEDKIEIYSPAKIATMEVIVMNNNDNTCSNISVLGRIPFKGNKDIETGENLGTTVDTILKTGIMSDSNNKANVTVYYSANENASKDLNDAGNGWITDVQNFENVKSYLIVTNNDYVMQPGEVLKFSYDYEIPANLEHNNSIYGTFMAYYKNEAERKDELDSEVCDKVGLTTGEGPQFDFWIESSAGEKSIKEYQELTYTLNIKNKGKQVAEDIKINFNIPERTSLVKIDNENEDVKISNINTNVEFTIDKLDVDQTRAMKVIVKVNKLPSIYEYYSKTEGFRKTQDGKYMIQKEVQNENGETSLETSVIEKIPDIKLIGKATVNAKDLAKEFSSNETTNIVTESKFVITESAEFPEHYENLEDYVLSENEDLTLNIDVSNVTKEILNNVVIKTVLPNELSYKDAYILGFEANGLTVKRAIEANYNMETRTVEWTIDKIEPSAAKQAKLIVVVNNLESGLAKKSIEIYSEVSAQNVEVYTSNILKATLGRPSLTVTQTSNITNTYVKEGNLIDYKFNIKNEGPVVAKDVVVKDMIPDGLKVRSLTYTADGLTSTKKVADSDAAEVKLNIPANCEANVVVTTFAKSLNGAAEKSVTNYGTVSSTQIGKIDTNSITHIIEQDVSKLSINENITGNKVNNLNTNNSNANLNNSSNSQIQTVANFYKITGKAWLDENRNGKRDSNEVGISDVTVKLINSSTNTVLKTVKSSSTGDYTFSDLTAGKYLVSYEYDTNKYSLTEYQKAEVERSVNSDAIMAKIEDAGNIKNGAVTDTIQITDVSVSNIDIGFVLAKVFDLKLDKAVTKISIQNTDGTQVTEYNNSKLAKKDIAAKKIAGSIVLVEYTLTVTNEGDVEGKATKLVDYMPSSMKFNSKLNSNWYTGSDGNIYTLELQDIMLAPGESKQVKLVLTKEMTTENTGLVNNNAEIYETYNAQGIVDIDSTPANKVQNEDDMSSADALISVNTGETFIYISVIITTMMLVGIGVFIVKSKIDLKKKRGDA